MKFSHSWPIATTDPLFTMKKTYTAPATTRASITYRMGTVPTTFKEDVWVQAAEAKPGNRAVVHHIIVFVIKPGEGRKKGEDGIGTGFLVGFAPGDLGATFAEGAAKKVPKGAALVFQMHYTPNGTQQTDR